MTKAGNPSTHCASPVAHRGVPIRLKYVLRRSMSSAAVSVFLSTWLALHRWTSAFGLILPVLTIGCGEAQENGPIPSPPEDPLALGARYVEDANFRRATLVASLENPNNGYSKYRLEHYTEDDWGSLPEWNPRHAAIAAAGDATPPASDDPAWTTLDVDGVAWDMPSLVELGRRAFFEYPMQLAPYVRGAMSADTPPSHYGLWTDATSIGGVVWTELPKGSAEPAFTCAVCHASMDPGGVVEGRNNADVNVGALITDYNGGAPIDWGPGRIDVTNDAIDNPTAIADLRAVRSQVALQRAATVRNGLVALAIRIETLMIGSLGTSVRPPRKLAFATALYLWELEPEPVRIPDASSRRGESTFGRYCASCHRPPRFSGPSIAIAEVGTDPSVGMSPDRTTGFYRVPSLRGVGDRRSLFANGAARDIRDLLDPNRTAKGHTYGLSLDATETAELISYLETL